MSIRHLDFFFEPRTVAVIGASERPRSVRATVWHNLGAGGYAGALYAVNPKHGKVGTARCWPDVASLPAMVPAVIPMLLLMLPAMLTALAVVREKETGSILKLYVTPVTRSEFLLGKQLPYLALALLNFVAPGADGGDPVRGAGHR